MARIFYGVNGEGLGHASRSLAVIEHMPEHEFHVFTYGKALEYFKRINYPRLTEINGLMFSYKNDRVDYFGTFCTTWYYYWHQMTENVRLIANTDRMYSPSLYISDFEPSVPRAAKKTGRKLISIDNQHRFAYVDMLKLPLRLRLYGWGCGLAAKCMVPCPDHTIISTFHWDKIKVRRANITLTNGLLRKGMEEEQVKDDNFVLVYLRRSVQDKILNTLKGLSYKFVVFGASMPTPLARQLLDKPNFMFLPTSPVFTKYLANCSCVISTAGNQLLTEARFWRKPVLAIPEPGQHEQEINATYAEYVNMARKCDAKSLSPHKVGDFLNNWRHACCIRYEPHITNGVHQVAEIIRSYL